MSSDSYGRAYDLLPDYVCGLIWVLNALCFAAFHLTLPEFTRFISQVAKASEPIHIPELAVGFLVAVFGVLLPYAAAIVLNPAAAAIANTLLRLWHWKRAYVLATREHAVEVQRRIRTRFGVDPPRSAWHVMIIPYLRHINSSAAEHLRKTRNDVSVRAYLALPASLLVAFFTYALLGQTIWAVFAAIGIGLLALGTSLHGANRALIVADEAILLAFLAITASESSATPTNGNSAANET